MKAAVSVFVLSLLCVVASAMLYLTQCELRDTQAAYRELFDHRPDAELVKDTKTGAVIIRIDGKHYYLFQSVCPALRKT